VSLVFCQCHPGLQSSYLNLLPSLGGQACNTMASFYSFEMGISQTCLG
jgi:hypothetical protein